MCVCEVCVVSGVILEMGGMGVVHMGDFLKKKKKDGKMSGLSDHKGLELPSQVFRFGWLQS